MNENAPNKNQTTFQIWFRGNATVIYGFLGWWAFNGALWFLDGLLLFINMIGLVVLGTLKPKIAFGALVAFSLNLLIALVMGMAAAGACFIPFFAPGANSFLTDDNLSGIPECIAVGMLVAALTYGSFLWNRRDKKS